MNRRSGTDRIVFRTACILCLFIAAVHVAGGATFNVGKGSAEISTIEEAVDTAIDGDTIIVNGGVFDENLYIDHRIALIGRETAGQKPVLSAGGDMPGIVVAVTGCRIEGLVVQDAGDYEGIRIDAGGATVKGCEVTRCGDGIALYGSGNTIVGNTVQFSRRSGIALVQSDDNTITRNVLSGNAVSGLSVGQGTTGNQIYLNSFGDEIIVYAGDAASWISPESMTYVYAGAPYTGRLGNYWKGYSGSDEDGNGVGERPFVLDGAKGGGTSKSSAQSRRDPYPLVKTLASYTITAGDGFVDLPPMVVPDSSEVTTIQSESTTSETAAATASNSTLPGGEESTGSHDSTLLFLILAAGILGGTGIAIFGIVRRNTGIRLRKPEEPAGTSTITVIDGGLKTIPSQKEPSGGISEGHEFFFPQDLRDKYQRIEYVGKGGIARIYRAIRKSDGQYVAVKIPIRFDELTGLSFMKEIKVWEGLRHPNIVVISGGNILPIPYFEMEYLPSSLDREPLPMQVCEAAHIVDGITQGLAYAHHLGVVHRDLKPQNILLTADRVPKISDWGLSKVTADGTESKIGGYSPFYAAPEQISPKQFGSTDARTDLYQVGVLFYELVTGRTPGTGESLAEIVTSILHEKPVDPSFLNPDAVAVEPIILKCLEKDPAKRYASADDLHRDLEAYLTTCRKTVH